ncbi:hypothetical protein SAMN05519103_06175 [Rhizobiales bacterium GAS113]|nr:hypothetical protein SAMN05519103_06175 [Rhizobiales bacterium GAS113]
MTPPHLPRCREDHRGGQGRRRAAIGRESNPIQGAGSRRFMFPRPVACRSPRGRRRPARSPPSDSQLAASCSSRLIAPQVNRLAAPPQRSVGERFPFEVPLQTGSCVEGLGRDEKRCFNTQRHPTSRNAHRILRGEAFATLELLERFGHDAVYPQESSQPPIAAADAKVSTIPSSNRFAFGPKASITATRDQMSVAKVLSNVPADATTGSQRWFRDERCSDTDAICR